jgi:hypothetical protein
MPKPSAAPEIPKPETSEAESTFPVLYISISSFRPAVTSATRVIRSLFRDLRSYDQPKLERPNSQPLRKSRNMQRPLGIPSAIVYNSISSFRPAVTTMSRVAPLQATSLFRDLRSDD